MKMTKRLLSILLSLVMVLGLMPGMSFTAYAETPYVSVSTYDGLIAAISDGNNVRLISDIEVTSCITVSSQIIIDGAGHKLTKQGTDRAFLVSGTLVLKDLTVSGFQTNGGGAIRNSGTLVLDGCTFSGNSSPSSTAGGGAIENKGKLYAADTVFTGNYTGELGGAINNYSGSLYLTQCTFTQNYTTANNEKYGGAIGNNSNGDVRIINCTFSDNYYDYNASKKRSDLGVFQTPTNYTIAGCAGINITPSSSGLTTAPYGTALLDYSDLNNIKLLYEASDSSQIYSIMISGGANAATSGGNTNQVGLTGAMTTVTYSANTGYYFAEFTDITNNGITAKRTSSTVVTVSGTPTADAAITVPDAVAIPTYEVTYKVVNGTWSDGITTDKKETVQSGAKPASVPTGMKASEGYTGGAWDTDPASAVITGAKTFTYTFTAKQAATVTKAPEAKSLAYNGSAQELVTAGTATGGEMWYALGTATEATGPYTTSIPTATDAGTYYVWYKVVGDDDHADTKPTCIAVTIAATKPTQTAPAAPVVTATTPDSITVKTVRGVEFSIDGEHWQTSGVFTGLNPDTTYVIQARKPETESHAASPASKTVVNTPAAQSQPGSTWSLGLRILNALNIINSARQTTTRWNPWSVRTIWTPWWLRR